jgi:hypothetical protein
LNAGSGRIENPPNGVLELKYVVGRRDMGTCLRVARLVGPALVFGAVFACSTAAAESVQTTTPFAIAAAPNPCNGDVVNVVGQSHVVTVVNDHKLEVQENWPDTSGVALDGTTYQVNDANHSYFTTAPDGGFTFGLRDSFELVSNDGSSNDLVHVTVELSFDPDTGFETKISGAGTECSGPTPAP